MDELSVCDDLSQSARRFGKTAVAVAILAAIVTSSGVARATTTLCAVNDWTGEAHEFNSDEYMGLGWEARPGERGCDDFKAIAAASGYRYTSWPHKLEYGLLLLAVLLTPGILCVGYFASSTNSRARPSRG